MPLDKYIDKPGVRVTSLGFTLPLTPGDNLPRVTRPSHPHAMETTLCQRTQEFPESGVVRNVPTAEEMTSVNAIEMKSVDAIEISFINAIEISSVNAMNATSEHIPERKEQEVHQSMDDVPQDLNEQFTEPYTLFTKNERRWIVTMIALATSFSTLSSFIYFPAIPAVARDLKSSISMINLTVTSYLIVSAIAPAFVGDASEIFGRRPLYVVTLALYVAANVAIARQNSAVGLLLLRMVQSAGVSGKWRIRRTT